MKKVKLGALTSLEHALLKMAKKARKNAFCPYSEYKVGAALLADNGRIYSGCNVESAIYQTTHAEKNAIDSMITDGGREITTLCCVAENGGIPCAECRQFIWEFCGNDPLVKIISVSLNGEISIFTIGELYPYPFGPKNLGVDTKKY